MNKTKLQIEKEMNRGFAELWCNVHELSTELIKDNNDGTFTFSITFGKKPEIQPIKEEWWDAVITEDVPQK